MFKLFTILLDSILFDDKILKRHFWSFH